MSANVESLFYVRETPWHGLGFRCEEAQTSEEALKVSGLDWSVVPQKVFVGGREVPNYVANVRDFDNEVLGIVTGKYKIVQNKPAFQFTDALVGTGEVKYETAGSLNHGRKVWMLAKLPETKVLDDKVCPYLVFTNSHDGTGAIKVAITPVRVVCQNTLNFALDTAKRSWSTRHMGDMESKLLEAKRTFEMAGEYMDKFAFDAVSMANKIVDKAYFDQFVETLFPMPAEKDLSNRQETNVLTLRNTLTKVYETTADLNAYRGTAWGVINSVSDMVTHAIPLRVSNNYKENLFGKVIEGHTVIDRAYDLLRVA